MNGSHAAEAAGRTRFDLIIMDVEMPEMDGLEATRTIRAAEEVDSRQRVPILALTAHALMGYRERCLQSGCTSYLAKPVRKQMLLDAVAATMAESATANITPFLDREIVYIKVDPDLADLAPGFLDNCRRDLARAQLALEASDWTVITRFGHSLKGAAPSYGFDEIGRLGKEIEVAAKATLPERAQTVLISLASYLQTVRISEP